LRTHASAQQTNPNPPLGEKNISNTQPAKVALIGARGYTGQALINHGNGGTLGTVHAQGIGGG
jgi:N-acetyl-gamma-glutamyl-phosphate reductase/acetylglutamate kinase